MWHSTGATQNFPELLNQVFLGLCIFLLKGFMYIQATVTSHCNVHWNQLCWYNIIRCAISWIKLLLFWSPLSLSSSSLPLIFLPVLIFLPASYIPLCLPSCSSSKAIINKELVVYKAFPFPVSPTPGHLQLRFSKVNASTCIYCMYLWCPKFICNNSPVHDFIMCL